MCEFILSPLERTKLINMENLQSLKSFHTCLWSIDFAFSQWYLGTFHPCFPLSSFFCPQTPTPVLRTELTFLTSCLSLEICGAGIPKIISSSLKMVCFDSLISFCHREWQLFLPSFLLIVLEYVFPISVCKSLHHLNNS